MEYSVFEYLYRDAANFKVYGEILLMGRVRSEHELAISGALIDALYFVPTNAGLPALQEGLVALSHGLTQDDHDWHEFSALRAASAEQIARLTAFETVDAFVERFGVPS